MLTFQDSMPLFELLKKVNNETVYHEIIMNDTHKMYFDVDNKNGFIHESVIVNSIR